MLIHNNRPQRKYVYPVFVFLLVILFVLKSFAGENSLEPDLETKMLRQEVAARTIESSWFDNQFADYRKIRNDVRDIRQYYRIDESPAKAKERHEYRQKRHEIMAQMTAGNLAPSEYRRLRKELRAVDLEYASPECHCEP